MSAIWTKTLSRFIAVDFIIKMMGWSDILMPHFFLFKITSCKVTSHWRQNTELSATNGLKLFAASLKNPLVQRIIHSINKKCFATCYRCHDINGLPIRGLPFLRNDTECSKKMFFVLRLIISRVIRHCKFYRKAHALFWKKFSDMFFSN